MRHAVFMHTDDVPLIPDKKNKKKCHPRDLRRAIPCCGFPLSVLFEFFVVGRFIYLDILKDANEDHDGHLASDKLWFYWVIDSTSLLCGLFFSIVGAYLDVDGNLLTFFLDHKFWAIDNIFVLAIITGASYAIVLEDENLEWYRVATGTSCFIFVTLAQSFLFRCVITMYNFSSCGWLWYKIQRLSFVVVIICYGTWGLLHDMPMQELLFVTTYLTFSLEMYFTCNRLDSSDSISLNYGNLVSEYAIAGDDQWAVSRHDDEGYIRRPR